mmetsp:Transcript_30746/g.52576  ORF Transcript_30746/g.52576 Transcript_30746/m.52576 type:complete len:273 (-) Transcript_30746:3512-4330(-)
MYPSVLSHCPPMLDATRRTACLSPPPTSAWPRTSISSTRSFSRRVAYLAMRPDMSSLNSAMMLAGAELKGVRMCRKRCDEAVGSTDWSRMASCSSSSDFCRMTSAFCGATASPECVMPRTKRRCCTRGLLPCEPRSTTVLCPMDGRRSGAQLERRSSSSWLYMVGYRLRRPGSSAYSSVSGKANCLGHLGGLGTISETRRMPLALSVAACDCSSADTSLIIVSSAPAPASMAAPSARWRTLAGSGPSPSYVSRRAGSSSVREARSGTSESVP